MPKHKNTITVDQSIANINKILAQFKELIMLVNDNKFADRLKELSELVEYANPTTDGYIANLDNKISNNLGDLKIQLTTRQPRHHINFKMETITLLITERNAKA